MIQKLKKNNAGFTLVELIVVIAILGILAAVLVPQYTQYIEKSRQKTDYATLSEIQHAANLELATLETVPANDTVLFAFTVSSAGAFTPAATPGTLATALEAVIGSGTLKSAKSADSYTLICTGGKAVWGAGSAKVTALQAGNA